jgi:hypothetical protein
VSAHAALIARLEAAEAGSRELSRLVFAALGGIERSEAVSNQGGAVRRLPYWPGEQDPAMGVSFTTSLNDLVHELKRRCLECSVTVANGRAWARVGTVGLHEIPSAATPRLALCAALLSHLERAGDAA